MGIFWDRLKLATSMLVAGMPGVDLPASGRSSEETLAGSMGLFLNGLGSVSPVVDFEMLRTLKCLWLYNPDMSKYVANIVNLGNPGHSLQVDAANDSKAEAAVNRLNEAAVRLFPQSCGVDGLLDQYLTSIAWSGAISSEDVVNVAARRVEKVVLVPVEQIRFKYNKDLDVYEAFQRSTSLSSMTSSNLGLIKLNPETYKYFALSTVENSPYAKPPATAAVEAILEGQKPIMDNIRWVAKKYGILGLVAMGIAPIRQKGGETDADYAKRFEEYIKKYADSLSGNFNKGLVVYPKPNTIETTSVAAGAQGLKEVDEISDRKVLTGMGTEPAFHGRSDSTTETFADVVYYLLTAQTGKMQRVAKRRQEATYMLDLRLGGIDVDGVTLTFNKAHSRNALEEAQTESMIFDTVLKKIRSGAISPVDGANELGLDGWFDEEQLLKYGSEVINVIRGGQQDGSQLSAKTIRLKFDKFSQKYRYMPEQIVISNLGSEISEEGMGGNVVPIKKKALMAGA